MTSSGACELFVFRKRIGKLIVGILGICGSGLHFENKLSPGLYVKVVDKGFVKLFAVKQHFSDINIFVAVLLGLYDKVLTAVGVDDRRANRGRTDDIFGTDGQTG